MFGNLKTHRNYEGLTTEEVAKKLKVHRSTYDGWEICKDFIPLKRLNQLANFYLVSVDYLVGKVADIEKIKEPFTIDKQFVADTLKKVRLENHLTQKKMAEVLNTCQSNISNYESGKTLITTTYALQFSKQFDYSMDKLLGRK